ncbi:hypothetical protein JHK85_042948 [Glycine max]|nr:hypothetical protein JHK85_042948 [Glycine max]
MAGARRLGVAVDFSACSIKALNWTVDNVVREGDNLILIIVRNAHGYEHGEMQLWETTGSPLIPLAEFSDPVLMKRYELKPAPEVIDIVSTAAKQKNIVVLMKIYWGDARERVIMGSVSNYVVNNATCPVTVVKSSVHNY